MIVTYVPVEDGTLVIVGLMTEDLALMVAGDQPDTVDFRRLFARGQALPGVLQIIYARDPEHFWGVMSEMFPAMSFTEAFDERGTCG